MTIHYMYRHGVFWKRTKRKLEVVPDDQGQPRDAVHSRLDRAEADIADLYDRLKRLTGRLAKREQRDEDSAAPADGAAAAAPRRLPSIADLRARGRLPWNS